jgi:DNA-binding response OmpR family regulator
MPLFDYFRKRIASIGSIATTAASAPPEPVAVENGPVERRRRPRRRVPPGTSVLIIDDSKTMVAALGRMLRENQFTILEAFDGEGGLEVLRKNKPDLIFLDIVLPGMTGFDVLRRIRRSQYVGKVPVIIMSGNEAATEEYYVRRIGADDFMRKPCSRAEVFSRVERLLDLKPNALDGSGDSPVVAGEQ